MDLIKKTESSETASEAAPPAAAEELSKTILVIEDDEDLLALEQIILEADGYTVLTAQSGAEACRVLNVDATPDLILLDMHLEDMDGTQFLDLIHDKRPELTGQVPVVFLTGMDRVSDARCAGFVRKPILDISLFLKMIRQFIEDGQRATPLVH